jgi:oxygen-dependent protoporphyrinogen oxidase
MAAACPEFWDMEVRHGSLSAGERARTRQGGAGPEASGARYGQFVTLASGMETLVARLDSRLETAGVRRIVGTAQTLKRQANDGWSLTVESQTPGGVSSPAETLRADGIVVAIPSAAAAALLTPVDGELAAQLGEIEYAGSAVVSLGFNRADVAHPLDAAGMVVPRVEGRRALAISFSSSKFPQRTPAGCVLVRVFLGGALDPAANQLDDQALVALALGEAADLIGARGAPLLVQVNRWAKAMPQYHLGHLSRVARIRERLKHFPGIALAGNAYEGVGIPQVIASGQAAAARLMLAVPEKSLP